MKYSQKVWADNMRVLATVSMILLHVISPILYKFGNASWQLWHAGNLIDSAVRFCVPVFVMLSGALLLGKDFRLKDFLVKRLLRVVLPFVFWSGIYIVYDLLMGKSRMVGLANWLVLKVQAGAAYHLWYIYMIVGLYLFIPILNKWIKHCSQKEIQYFLCIWFTTLMLNQSLFSRFKPAIELSYFSGFLGYLVLGYYLSTVQFANIAKAVSISFLLLGVGITATAWGTFHYSAEEGRFVGILYGFLTPNVLLTSAGVFILVRLLTPQKKRDRKLRDFICTYSYGIYLVHVLVLSELGRRGLNYAFVNPAVGIISTTVCCIAFSALLVFLISRFPYGKYVSG
ncbi:acyltransferase [Pedobacter sp. SYSU D00535]|uniref:acyltransferase n=1 Tax=Pedobacter sp. SYSU D00535 TaxID=2810308 RepID=UPI001A966E22|nr:acyltransferase family protein [Pedobacter sp. SYSU D00535]